MRGRHWGIKQKSNTAESFQYFRWLFIRSAYKPVIANLFYMYVLMCLPFAQHTFSGSGANFAIQNSVYAKQE